jgi:hypothetical protein
MVAPAVRSQARSRAGAVGSPRPGGESLGRDNG